MHRGPLRARFEGELLASSADWRGSVVVEPRYGLGPLLTKTVEVGQCPLAVRTALHALTVWERAHVHVHADVGALSAHFLEAPALVVPAWGQRGALQSVGGILR